MILVISHPLSGKVIITAWKLYNKNSIVVNFDKRPSDAEEISIRGDFYNSRPRIRIYFSNCQPEPGDFSAVDTCAPPSRYIIIERTNSV